MNTDDNEKSTDVMKAIEKIMSVDNHDANEGVNLLAIVKKISRNRKKGESLE
jgi:hypothetical protein